MGDVYTNPPQSRNEAILRATIDGTEYTAPPQSRIEDLLLELKEAIEQGGTGEGDMKKSVYDSDNAVATAGGIKMFVNSKIGTLPQRVGSLETTAGVLEGEVADIEDTLDTLGTASTKNSTSVVTDSSDLVESGAVCRAIGIDFKNLLPLTVSAIKAKNTEGSWNGDVYTFRECTYTLVRVDNSEYIAKIVVNGQATGGNSLFYLPLVDLSNGSYLGSSGIEYSISSAFMQARAVDGTTNYYNFNADGVEITNRTIDQIYCAVMNGNSASNVSLYPMIRKATVSDPTYEPYHASVEESLAEKCDNSVIAPVENGTTASQAYAVGSHAIRNGAFITWKNAKAQGETINDASDYTSGDVASELRYGFQSISINGLIIDCARFGKVVILTISNGTNTEAYSANDIVVSLSAFTTLFTNETFAIPSETLDTFDQTLRLYVGRNENSLKVRANVEAGTVIRTTIVGYLN